MMTFKKGYKQTEEHKKKIAMANRGGHIWKDREHPKGMLGKKMSEDCKKKKSEFWKKWHKENKDKEVMKIRNSKIAIKLKGKKKSKEHNEKNRLGHLGQVAWNKGKKWDKDRIHPRPTLGKTSNKKGKTYEEIYGKNRAKQLLSVMKSKSIKEEMKKRISDTLKKYYKDNPSERERNRKQRQKQIFPMNDSSIEIKIQNFLKELNIEYFAHKYMNIKHDYQCDILIPSMNLVIECDGNYWHKYPVGLEKDHIRTNELIEKGFSVLRLWESEIKVMNINDFENKLGAYH